MLPVLSTIFEWNATNTSTAFTNAGSIFSDFTPFLQTMIFPILVAVIILGVLINAIRS
jgi:uncharacterized protein (DUF2062 family)